MAVHDLTFEVNGSVERCSVESRTLLIHALRDELGYTGTKIGCETGKCGACTVQLNGQAVKSCLILAAQADGDEINTVEGMGCNELDPLQGAFAEEHGLQCGYCTPGLLMTVDRLLADSESLTRAEIRDELKGNICRCTGYHNIVNAVERAAKTRHQQRGQ